MYNSTAAPNIFQHKMVKRQGIKYLGILPAGVILVQYKILGIIDNLIQLFKLSFPSFGFLLIM